MRYYEGEKGTTVNMGTSGRYTHYSTSYKNIKEKLAGYCENCDRNAFNAKEENWPKPGIGNWIAMAVSVALALGGAAITVNQFKQLEAGMNTTLTQKMYYVVVDTPEGSFGRDINGLYQE